MLSSATTHHGHPRPGLGVAGLFGALRVSVAPAPTGIYILIAVGAVMLFVGFLGCYGAIPESQSLLGTVRSGGGGCRPGCLCPGLFSERRPADLPGQRNGVTEMPQSSRCIWRDARG